MAIKTVDIGNVNWAEVMPKMPVATETSNGLLSANRNTDTIKFHMGGIHNAIRLSISGNSHVRNSYRIFGIQAAQNMCFDASIHLYIMPTEKHNPSFYLFKKDSISKFDFVFAYKDINGSQTELYLVYTGEAKSDANVIYIKPMGVSESIRNNMMLANIEDLSGYTIINPTSI